MTLRSLFPFLSSKTNWETPAMRPHLPLKMWEHRGWGDLIEWSNIDERKIRGCYRKFNLSGFEDMGLQFGSSVTPIRDETKLVPLEIEPGVIICDRMKGIKEGETAPSAITAYFVVLEAKYSSDPRDFFTATLRDLFMEDR